MFLQNKLTKCRAKLQELNTLIEAKSESQPLGSDNTDAHDWNQGRDSDKLTKIVDTYINDRSLGSVDDIMNVSAEAFSFSPHLK